MTVSVKPALMKFSAIIFDLDGTLLDTIDDITDSMNAVLAKLGLPGQGTDFYKKIVGEGVEQLANLALPKERNNPETLKKLANGMKDEYSKRWAVKTKPYDGIIKLLLELARLNIRMSVLSNKSDDLTRQGVEKFFDNFKFECVRGAREGVPAKPNPHVALEIAAEMKLDPSAFIFLGDSWIDMKTAVSAGMCPVGALWGFRKREELESSGARAVIADPRELLQIFTK